MATNRVAELRHVMEKFAEFYSQKLCESEEIPAEPMRTTAKCRVLEHYVDDVKMQIDHFLSCIEKWDNESVEKMDKLKRSLREHADKAERQLKNSESTREQLEVAIRELGVRCESLEKNQRITKHQYDAVLSEIARITDSVNAARVSGRFNEISKCQAHVQQPDLSRLLQAVFSLETVFTSSSDKPSDSVKYSRRSLGIQSENEPLLNSANDRKFSEEELLNAKKEIYQLEEKLREVRGSLSSVSQREQELVRDLHSRDREVARLKASPIENSPSKVIQQRLEVAEKEKAEWRAQADLYQQQLTKALDDVKKFQNERVILSESESALSYLQRELANERERCDSLETMARDREQEVEMYRSRYEEVMAENDRLETLLSERQMSCSQQDSSFRSAINEKEETIEQMRRELVHITTLLKDQRDKARSAEDQVRSLSIQLDAVKALQSTADGEVNAAVTAEQYFAKELATKTQDLTDTVRKLEMQLETTRHEKIVLEEEFARLKSRSSADQTALQHHADRVKDELRAQEQAANKMRSDMRLVWEEKLRTEQQMRELLDTQAVDHERNKTLAALLQQRDEEASSLRNQVAMLSEQVGEKDGIILQLRSEITRFDNETLALQRDAENTCELVRVRDNQLAEMRNAFERSCEAADAAKQELSRCETSMKRLSDELAEIRQKAAEARVEAERERTRATAAETQIAKLDSDRLYSEQQLAEAEAETSRLRQEVIELNDKIVNLDHDIVEARDFQERLRMDNYELAQSSENEMKERRRCETRMGELEMAVHMLEEQLQAYRQDVAVRDQAILRLRAETDQALARCQSAQEEMDVKDGDVRRVAQRAREQQMELRQALDNVALLEERLASAEARIAEVSQEREVALQDARNTEKIVDQVKRDALLLKTEQETETSRLKQTNDLLVVERDAARADVAELAQRLEHAREEIMALSRSNSDYQVELHQVSARCRQAELLIADQNSTISELRQRFGDTNDDLERVRDDERRASMELETLRERCADLSERLASAEGKGDELDRLNSDMKCRIADLETIVIRMEADLQQTRLDLRNSKGRQAELELAIIQLKDVIDSERSAAESVAFRLQAEEIISADLKEKLSRVCQDNSVLEESYSRLLADFRCYETDHRYSNSEITDRDKRIEELESQIDSFTGDASSSQRKLAQLETTIESLKTELETVREDKTGIAEELKNVEEKLTSMRLEAQESALDAQNTIRLRENEIDELRRQVTEANTEYRVIKEEADAHLERIHALEIDIAATTTDLHQREDIIAQLECAMQELRIELDSTRGSLRESEARVNLMLSEVETAKREASDARQAYKQAASEQASAQQKAQVAEERATVSENEMNNKVGECVRLEGQVRRFQNELRSMQERLQDSEEDRSTLRENLQRLKIEIAQSRDSISKLTQENGNLKQQIAKTEMEFSGIREQHKMSVDQIGHQDQILAQLQEDLRQERAKNVETSRGCAESRRTATELRDSLSNAERQIRDLQNRLTSRDNAVEDAQRELLDCQAKLKQTRDELSEMEAQLRAAKVSHSASEREAQSVGDRVILLEKKTAELMSELDRTRDSLRSAQTIACEREQDSAMLQAELSRTRNQATDLAGQLNEVNRQLHMTQQEASRLRDQCALSAAQVSKAEEYSLAMKAQLDGQKGANDRIRELQSRFVDSEQNLAKARSEVEALKSEIDTMRSKYDELGRECKSLKDALVAEQKENQSKLKSDAATIQTNQQRMTERQREQAHAIAKLSAERDHLFMSLSQAESVLNDKESKIAEMRNHIAEQDHLIRDLVSQCAKHSGLRNGDAPASKSAPEIVKSSSISASSTTVATSASVSSKSGHVSRSVPALNGTSTVNKDQSPAVGGSRIPVAVLNGANPLNGVVSSPKSKRHSSTVINGNGVIRSSDK